MIVDKKQLKIRTNRSLTTRIILLSQIISIIMHVIHAQTRLRQFQHLKKDLGAVATITRYNCYRRTLVGAAGKQIIDDPFVCEFSRNNRLYVVRSKMDHRRKMLRQLYSDTDCMQHIISVCN